MLHFDPLKVRAERSDDHPRKHGHAVSVTLAASNDELSAGKVHILDSEPQTFQQPKSTSVQQCGDEPFGPAETAEYCPHFITRQNDR